MVLVVAECLQIANQTGHDEQYEAERATFGGFVQHSPLVVDRNYFVGLGCRVSIQSILLILMINISC